jgi:hypothetical protein
MKYIITFSIALALSMSALAQTGLVFSQCLTFAGKTDIINSNQYYSQYYTVPEGKIWKIESAFVNYFSYQGGFLQVNGHLAAALNAATSPFPIWAKSGDTIRIYNPGGGVNTDFFISILEFNAN